MPIYEYQCKSCRYTFEQVQKITDEPVKKCPKCKKNVEKLVSKSAFHLKGSGWYVTDYKKSEKSDEKKEVKNEVTKTDKAEKKIDKKKDKD